MFPRRQTSFLSAAEARPSLCAQLPGASARVWEGAAASACRPRSRARAPPPLPASARRRRRRNRGLGPGSAAGVWAAIPPATRARSRPAGTAQARAPGPPSARAPGLGGRGGGAGAARQKVRAGEVPPGRGLGAARSQGRRRPPARGRRPALCVRAVRVLQRRRPPRAGRKLPPWKRACVWLALRGLWSRASCLPCSPAGRADLNARAARGLPFLPCCWQRWTGPRCCPRSAEGECPGLSGLSGRPLGDVLGVLMHSLLWLWRPLPCSVFVCRPRAPRGLRLGRAGQASRAPPPRCARAPSLWPRLPPLPLAERSLLAGAPRPRKLAAPLKKADSWP